MRSDGRKNSELPIANPLRKYKGRVVFQGNTVTDQNWEWAMFQEVASQPASMQASKCCDAYGSLPGHIIEQADATQAYTQAELGGVPTYIRIPREYWPKEWFDKHGQPKYRDPVCRLIKALYGHPESGAYWEKHCEKQLLAIGFHECNEWKSCFFHEKLKVFLIVYVDDFKMAGKKENVQILWKQIQETTKIDGQDHTIVLDEPEPIGRFLGCEHRYFEKDVTWHGEKLTSMGCNAKNGAIENIEEHKKERKRRKVRGIYYDMTAFMQECVTLYGSLTGIDTATLPRATTPFVESSGKDFGIGTEANDDVITEEAITSLRRIFQNEDGSRVAAAASKTKKEKST